MANINTVTHEIPPSWASAFVNDDFSGLSDDCIADIAKFRNDNPGLGDCIDVKDEEYFVWNCQAVGGLGSTVVEATFYQADE